MVAAALDAAAVVPAAVTEVRKVKHAYETGIRTKRGIDF
jgi:ATP:corrinoid adenosyltransferase